MFQLAQSRGTLAVLAMLSLFTPVSGATRRGDVLIAQARREEAKDTTAGNLDLALFFCWPWRRPLAIRNSRRPDDRTRRLFTLQRGRIVPVGYGDSGPKPGPAKLMDDLTAGYNKVADVLVTVKSVPAAQAAKSAFQAAIDQLRLAIPPRLAGSHLCSRCGAHQN